jgi:hypothetical protein
VDNSAFPPNHLTFPIDPAYPSFKETSHSPHFKQRGFL